MVGQDARALLLLGCARVLGYVSEHAWNYAVPLLLARCYPSLILPVAVFASIQVAAVSFTNPTLAQWVERTERLDSTYHQVMGSYRALNEAWDE